jgi:hypothetical protein
MTKIEPIQPKETTNVFVQYITYPHGTYKQTFNAKTGKNTFELVDAPYKNSDDTDFIRKAYESGNE